MSIANCGVRMAAKCLEQTICKLADTAASEVLSAQETGIVGKALVRVIEAQGIGLHGVDKTVVSKLFAARIKSMFQCGSPAVTPAMRDDSRRNELNQVVGTNM